MKKIEKISLLLLGVIVLNVTMIGMASATDIPVLSTWMQSVLLFQKCDDTLKNKPGYDAFGCPNIGTGPWPIFPANHRWGELEYSLWGLRFRFAFEGHNLLPNEDYTLIYYPDPWPGNGLICLGSGKTSAAQGEGNGKRGRGRYEKWGHGGHGKCGREDGDIEIHGNVDIGTSLPAPYDANFDPISPSGAVGAKVWLVLSDDVECTTNSTQMVNWNPTAYLFENNLIVFENQEVDMGKPFEKD